jgi:hypothetical protein
MPIIVAATTVPKGVAGETMTATDAGTAPRDGNRMRARTDIG